MTRRLLIGSLLVGLFSASLAIAVDAPASRPAATTGPTTLRVAHDYELRYKLADGSDAWPADKRAAIDQAMSEAVAMYNEYGEFDKRVTATYSPGTPTADSNYDGWMRFGGSISTRVALHELGHTMGVGTTRQWQSLVKDGVWQGPHATALVKAFDGPDAVLHGDRQHFWPYGLNFDREDSPTNRIRHVLMVAALRQDMGIENGKR